MRRFIFRAMLNSLSEKIQNKHKRPIYKTNIPSLRVVKSQFSLDEEQKQSTIVLQKSADSPWSSLGSLSSRTFRDDGKCPHDSSTFPDCDQQPITNGVTQSSISRSAPSSGGKMLVCFKPHYNTL